MTDDETPISTIEAAKLLGCDKKMIAELIRCRRLDGWPIYASGGGVWAWKTTRAAVDRYKQTHGRSQLRTAQAGRPSWLAAS